VSPEVRISVLHGAAAQPGRLDATLVDRGSSPFSVGHPGASRQGGRPTRPKLHGPQAPAPQPTDLDPRCDPGLLHVQRAVRRTRGFKQEPTSVALAQIESGNVREALIEDKEQRLA
jgi:hypothetical protein